MKKTMSIILALAMSMSMTVTAFADQIQPRSPSCDECGSNTIRYSIIDPGLAPSTCDICGDVKVHGVFYGYKYVCSNSECDFEGYLQGEFICYNCR